MTLYKDHPRLAELAVLHQRRHAADVRVRKTRKRNRVDAMKKWHDLDELFAAARSRWEEQLQKEGAFAAALAVDLDDSCAAARSRWIEKLRQRHG